jgi:hypothetical protein
MKRTPDAPSTTVGNVTSSATAAFSRADRIARKISASGVRTKPQTEGKTGTNVHAWIERAGLKHHGDIGAFGRSKNTSGSF